jgi:YfdX protein
VTIVRKLAMNTQRHLILVAPLLVLVGLIANVASGASENEGLRSYLERSFTPDEEFIVASYAAKALHRLATARRDIAQKNIPGAQSELGKALTIIDGMKSRFVTARLQELVAAARIRLTYEEPRQVLAYLESITPVLADIQEPGAAKDASQTLERAKGFLKNNDKLAADRELGALADVLIYKTATRTLALADKHLLEAASELDKGRPADAARSIEAAEAGLRIIATQLDMPLSQTKKHLSQATADYAAGRWSDAKGGLERASRFLEQALKGANAAGRDAIQDLYRDVQDLFHRFNQTGKNFGDLIVAGWERANALQERALEYQTMAWERFQSSSPGSANLIEANLHVAFGKIYEFTTGENDKARTELEKAESYVKNAEAEVSRETKPKLTALTKQIAATKAEVGKNRPAQKERYAALEHTLSQLVH